MIADFLIIIALLWLTLAVAVGFHAKGHNRSGIIWFCVVAITGIFGLAFYLLAITSADSERSDTNSETDEKIIRNTPLVVLGFFVGLGISFVFVILLFYTLPSVTRPEPFYGLMLLSGLVGAGSGPYAYSRLKNVVESRVNIAGYFSSTSVNLSRRRTIGLVGVGTTALLGGIVYNYDPQLPKPDPSIEDTSVQYESDGGTVTVEMNNPREDSVTVEIKTFVEVVEIDGGVTGNRNEREEFSTWVSGTSTLPAESNHLVELEYEVNEKDSLENLELSDSPAPSFSIQTDEES